MAGSRWQERADVLANSGVHCDIESTVAGYFKGFVSGYNFCSCRAVDVDFAEAIDDVHYFRRTSCEAVGTWKDHTDCFLSAVGEMDGMGDDAAIEIDVSKGIGGNIGEGFHGEYI